MPRVREADRCHCEHLGQWLTWTRTSNGLSNVAAANASEAATAAPTTSGTTRFLLAMDDIKSDDELEAEVLKQLRELLANGGCVLATDLLAYACIAHSPRVASALSPAAVLQR